MKRGEDFLFLIHYLSALIGVGFVLISLPLPTLVAKFIMDAQAEKSKKVKDHRAEVDFSSLLRRSFIGICLA